MSVLSTLTGRRGRITLAAFGVSAAAAVLVPTAASADVQAPDSAPRDGYVHIYGSAGECKFYGTSNLGRCQNHVTKVENLGYSGGNAYVNLFYDNDQQGAYACIAPGTLWAQASGGTVVTFSRGTGPNHQDGKGRAIWNEVASVQWVSRCSG